MPKTVSVPEGGGRISVSRVGEVSCKSTLQQSGHVD